MHKFIRRGCIDMNNSCCAFDRYIQIPVEKLHCSSRNRISEIIGLSKLSVIICLTFLGLDAFSNFFFLRWLSIAVWGMRDEIRFFWRNKYLLLAISLISMRWAQFRESENLHFTSQIVPVSLRDPSHLLIRTSLKYWKGENGRNVKRAFPDFHKANQLETALKCKTNTFSVRLAKSRVQFFQCVHFIMTKMLWSSPESLIYIFLCVSN